MAHRKRRARSLILVMLAFLITIVAGYFDGERRMALQLALLKAARQGDYTTAKALLEQNVDPNSRYGMNIFERVQHWIKGDLLGRPLDTTALVEAVGGGHCDIARLLIEKGANIKTHCFYQPQRLEADSSVETTPIVEASQNGYIDIVRDLIRRGADTNFHRRAQLPDSDRLATQYDTALQAAVSGRHNAVVQLLRQAGAKE